jgi:hypothetical protein
LRAGHLKVHQTVVVLLSDLYEGGDVQGMLRRAGELRAAGVTLVALLALSDEGAPSYDEANAASLARLGVACFGCTPDKLAPMLAAAIQRRDLGAWAAENGLLLRGGASAGSGHEPG